MDPYCDRPPHLGGRASRFDMFPSPRNPVFHETAALPPPPPLPYGPPPPPPPATHLREDGSRHRYARHHQPDSDSSPLYQPSHSPPPYRHAHHHQGSRFPLPQMDRREALEKSRVLEDDHGRAGWDWEREVRRYHQQPLPSPPYREVPYYSHEEMPQKRARCDVGRQFEDGRGPVRSLQCRGFSGGDPVGRPRDREENAYRGDSSRDALFPGAGEIFEGYQSCYMRAREIEEPSSGLCNFRGRPEDYTVTNKGSEAGRGGFLPWRDKNAALDSWDDWTPKGDDRSLPMLGRHQHWASTIEERATERITCSIADHGFQEGRFLGSKDSRRMSNGGGRNSRSPVKTPSKKTTPWKRSALSRIQSVTSVFCRLEEKQPLESPHSLPHSVVLPIPIDESRPLPEDPDVSIKSNFSVAKELVSLGSTIPSSDGNGPLIRARPKKMKKKKLVKAREKVVIPIITDASYSGGLKKACKVLGKRQGAPCRAADSPSSQRYSPSASMMLCNETSSNVCTDSNVKLFNGCLVPVEGNIADSLSAEEHKISNELANANCADAFIRALKIPFNFYQEEQRLDFATMTLENGVVEATAVGVFKTSDSINRDLEESNHEVLDGGNQAGCSTDFARNLETTPYFSEPGRGYKSQTFSCATDSMKGENEGSDEKNGNQHDLEFMLDSKEHEEACETMIKTQYVETECPDRASDDGQTFHDHNELLQPNCFSAGECKNSAFALTNSLNESMRDTCPSPNSLSEMDYMLGETNIQGEMQPMDMETSCSSLLVESFCVGLEVTKNKEESPDEVTKNQEESPDEVTKNQEETPTSKDDILTTSSKSFVSGTEVYRVSDKIIQHHDLDVKDQVEQSQDFKNHKSSDIKVAIGSEPRKDGSAGVVVEMRGFRGQPILTGPRNVRRKTWHQNGNPSMHASHGNLQWTSASLRKLPPKKIGGIQCSSYVRKGNSLIRKPPVESASHCLPFDPGLYSRVGAQKGNDVQKKVREAKSSNQVLCSNSSIERPKSPLLSRNAQLSGVNHLQGDTCPISEDPIPEAVFEAHATKSQGQSIDAIFPAVAVQSISNCRSGPTDLKTMTYVKRKSNQLIAFLGPEVGNSSSHTERIQKNSLIVPVDLYHRKRRNQLVRNSSSDAAHKKNVTTHDSNHDDPRTSSFSSRDCCTAGVPSNKSSKVSRRKSNKQVKFSHVWTLSGKQPSRSDAPLLNRMVVPSLIPWKSPLMKSIPSLYRCSFLGGKLQLVRKREMVFANLQKSGVVRNAGSSLKWSKSFQKRSKKEIEEPVLAANLEWKKREKRKRASSNMVEKHYSSYLREHIFRVGSARYKMDSSRRTLVRIPDEPSLRSNDGESRNDRVTSFVPRRLTIGNDEYVRVGNGNQLVRDPKKLIRILASEKVRWSLHTARQRLAKKQQYCQFFTRFGKCNKNDGKCPYIHDPTKITICTKFLRGVCFNNNCKLTHKVLPERMPDCSYFLQGTCTNTSCPYRHVNVNPDAPVCDGFLRGYCSDGDECCKKHSYICPQFEATGACTRGRQCKLHHPKGTNKPLPSRKRKKAKIQSDCNWRYFGSQVTGASGRPLGNLGCTAEEIHDEDVDLFGREGRFADFISLGDVQSDYDEDPAEEGLEDITLLWPKHREEGPDVWKLSPDALDALIKPVRLMKDVPPF